MAENFETDLHCHVLAKGKGKSICSEIQRRILVTAFEDLEVKMRSIPCLGKDGSSLTKSFFGLEMQYDGCIIGLPIH